MAENSGGDGLKSAYELALERLESQGIERPDATALSDETREKVSEIRVKAQARLAEVEILHRKSIEEVIDPLERERVEQEYRAQRQRIEARRDRDIEAARNDRSGA